MTKSAIVKRSACIRGRKTSISLEDAFWNYFKNIALEREISPSALVAEIEAQNRDTNLSSAIRLFVLEHATSRCDQADTVNTQPIARVSSHHADAAIAVAE